MYLLCQDRNEDLVEEGRSILQSMGFDLTVLLNVTQDGCEYAGFVDPYTTAAPTALPCPPPGFSSAPYINLTEWVVNPLNSEISWFAQQQQPISYLPESDFYCVATSYTPLSDVSRVLLYLSVHLYECRVIQGS